MMSVAAPGPVGTISLMGRLGQVSAFAAPAIATAVQHNAMRKSLFTAGAVVSSLFAQYLSLVVLASNEGRREW
jgi:hypothetical protein